MVDVGDKDLSQRVAVAAGVLVMQAATMAAIKGNQLAKGEVLAVEHIPEIGCLVTSGADLSLCFWDAAREELLAPGAPA